MSFLDWMERLGLCLSPSSLSKAERWLSFHRPTERNYGIAYKHYSKNKTELPLTTRKEIYDSIVWYSRRSIKMTSAQYRLKVDAATWLTYTNTNNSEPEELDEMFSLVSEIVIERGKTVEDAIPIALQKRLDEDYPRLRRMVDVQQVENGEIVNYKKMSQRRHKRYVRLKPGNEPEDKHNYFRFEFIPEDVETLLDYAQNTFDGRKTRKTILEDLQWEDNRLDAAATQLKELIQ